ncbi:DUF6789 family protein [Halostagnicola kamekurae]|nr:DUF6789 family protein [Halostagnicola kamekurae]
MGTERIGDSNRSMNRFGHVIAAGVSATAVMSLLLLLLEVQTRSEMNLFSVIARFIGTPNDPTVGFVLFAVAGSVGWPLLFLALEPYLPFGPDPAARGVVFASILWIPFVVAGRGNVDGPLLVLFGAYTLFAHWAYGFTLGAVYARLSSRP